MGKIWDFQQHKGKIAVINEYGDQMTYDELVEEVRHGSAAQETKRFKERISCYKSVTDQKRMQQKPLLRTHIG